ncbi:unnamed protein product [Caenorhabditis auriculariae]|uniref:Ground-like domain-containing protein n=1 Tax=Caenorhabditis auriculariae TaxID=2777116 RepID=A0A8S1GY79_9PELO|nr:unnamed protein product [Caenorhabditis auriculariae]
MWKPSFRFPAMIVALVFLALFVSQTSAADTCPKDPSARSQLGVGQAVCCNGLIQNLVETVLATVGDAAEELGLTHSLTRIVQSIQSFIQQHFGKAFEVVISRVDFVLNTHYNGTQLCKFASKNLHLAVYQTPGKYDINSAREAFFSNFGSKDAFSGAKTLVGSSLSSGAAGSSFGGSSSGFFG